MGDARIALADHPGLTRPLKRCQQEIRGFDHWVVVRAHLPILMPVWRPSRLDGREEAPCWREAYRPKGDERVVRSGSAWRKGIIVKNSLPSSKVTSNT